MGAFPNRSVCELNGQDIRGISYNCAWQVAGTVIQARAQRKIAGERRKIAGQVVGAGEQHSVAENLGLMGQINESCYFQTKDQLGSFTQGNTWARRLSA
jgi:hypothetical protein